MFVLFYKKIDIVKSKKYFLKFRLYVEQILQNIYIPDY